MTCTNNRWPKTPSAFLAGLAALSMVAQVASFALHPVPSPQDIAATKVPSHYPAGYTATDYARARAFDGGVFWGDLAATATRTFALLAIFFSGIANRLHLDSPAKSRTWLLRLLFLAGLFLALSLIVLPYRYCRFLHLRAFGQTPLDDWDWWKIVLLGLPVPLALFVCKYLLVICTLPLFRRRWWLAAAVGVFFIFDAVPEIISRTYPMDPVERVQSLEPGPLRETMQGALRKAGLDLPIMVVDESRRSKSANICLTGRAGREYILLTDTFAREYTPMQVSLALAHELGHFQRKKAILWIRLGTGLMLSLATFGLVALLTGRQALPVSAAPRVVVLTLLSGLVVSHAFAPMSLAHSRQEERMADRYALQLTGEWEEFQRLLVRVAQHELSLLDLPRWRYYLGASHPTFLERLSEAGTGTGPRRPPRDRHFLK